MGTKIYLGMPPANVVEWIMNHHGSSSHADTWYKYAGDTEWRTVSIIGEIAGTDSTPTSQIPDVTNVVALEIGSDVMSIVEFAFYYCSKLTSVTIPDSVTNIGDYVFDGCSGLTSVTIGNSVRRIGAFAFNWCSKLTSMTIPDSVTSIGYSAFSVCSNITSVTFSGKTKETVSGGMSYYSWELPSGCVLHCTDGDITL